MVKTTVVMGVSSGTKMYYSRAMVPQFEVMEWHRAKNENQLPSTDAEFQTTCGATALPKLLVLLQRHHVQHKERKVDGAR